MERAIPKDDGDDDRIVLSLLSSVEEGANSQRRIAAELGIALGLVNAYLKRCVKKGLVKVSEAPARRYAYYLTPSGFNEKSRLTVEYLSSSFRFFRQAKADFAQLFELAKARDFNNLVLSGKSDLAEIAILSAVELNLSIVAVVDPTAEPGVFVGMNLVRGFNDIQNPFDAIVVTDVRNPRSAFDEAVKFYGPGRVLTPTLLGLNIARRSGSDDGA